MVTWGEIFLLCLALVTHFCSCRYHHLCIYGGYGTPTEAGALGAFVVFVIALAQGMKWHQLKGALMEAAKLSAMIFTMIWGVLIYVRYLGFADLPGVFAD